MSAFSSQIDRTESPEKSPDNSHLISQMNLLPDISRKDIKSVTVAHSEENSPNKGGRHSTYSASPIQHKRSSIGGGIELKRISFLNHGSNPFVGEGSDGSKTNVHKNYEDFFTRNALIEEESAERFKTQEDEVKVPSLNSDISNEEDFNQVLQRVESMSLKKQTIIFDKLAKIMSAKRVKTDVPSV